MGAEEQIWKHRFVVAFVALMQRGGYGGDNLEIAYGYANECYGQDEEGTAPERSADGMYFALGDQDAA